MSYSAGDWKGSCGLDKLEIEGGQRHWPIAVPYFANLHLAVMRILLLQDKTQMGVNYYDHQMAISLKWYSNHSMVSIREGRRGNNFQLR